MSIVGGIKSLSKDLADFERKLADENLTDFDVKREWLGIWKAHHDVSNVLVVIDGEPNRRGTQEDLERVNDVFGLTIDWGRLTEGYSSLARRKGRKMSLPIPSESAYDKCQEEHFRNQNAEAWEEIDRYIQGKSKK